jgi:hypothetical protein
MDAPRSVNMLASSSTTSGAAQRLSSTIAPRR